MLPADLRDELDASTLLVGPSPPVADGIDIALLRKAIRHERKLDLVYIDNDGSETRRTVWPFALGFFENVRVLVAWCELRQGFRHFRTDRIRQADMSESRYARRRQVLLREWRTTQNIAAPEGRRVGSA